MDERETRHLGQEADRLLKDVMFQKAMAYVTNDAKNALVECEADDVLRLQAAAKACLFIEDVLNGWVIAAASLPKPTDPTVNNDPGVI